MSDLKLQANELRQTGLSYERIGEILRTPTMTVWWWLNPDKVAKMQPDRNRKLRQKQQTIRAAEGDCLNAKCRRVFRRLPTLQNTVEDLFNAFTGSCELCHKPEGIKLVADHNHITNQFRGWLCRNCNSGLGLLGDDPKSVADRLLAYSTKMPLVEISCPSCKRTNLKGQRGLLMHLRSCNSQIGLEIGNFARALTQSKNQARMKNHTPCNASALSLWFNYKSNCDLCSKSEKDNNFKLCMDHCHATGDFRGWLCHQCNRGLGDLGDNPQIAGAALLKYHLTSSRTKQLFTQAS